MDSVNSTYAHLKRPPESTRHNPIHHMDAFLFRNLLMLIQALYLLAVVALAAVAATDSFCHGQAFCVSGGADLLGTAYITVSCAAAGWCAIGTGRTMLGSSIYIAWKNSTGGLVLSSRTGMGHMMPRRSVENIASLIPTPPDVSVPAWAKITFTFKRPLSGAANISPTNMYIYAYSPKTPLHLDSQRPRFNEHSMYGIITKLDLTLPVSNSARNGSDNNNSSGTEALPFVQLPINTSYDDIVRYHGIIMFVAWIISPALGVFIARYLKVVLGVWWFRLHVFFMFVVTGLLTLSGITILVLFGNPPHFQGPYHEQLGLAIGISTIIQLILGVVSDRLYQPYRKSIPIWDKMHWWFGRLIIVAAFINVIFGSILFQNGNYDFSLTLKILFGVVVALIVIMFIFGEHRYSQTYNHIPDTDINQEPVIKEYTLPARAPTSSRVKVASYA
ncbi:hypothetical protein BASA50_001170 [Batrachochytrium salamandrivorans]|uniref:Cytochrome b561 domain-containing protein n=1 Tax=Batrachochytrium salamandrivorans TaxID=1357716 RepID=A0ABQ8ERT7_9FUNG|nr:hypothetical protein BASA50_001170 [Batrachochytrium salamandrivorans]